VLTAVAQVRNELPLIALSVANLLGQGVDRVIVADHGSDDGTAEWLARAAAVDDRVSAVHNSSTRFHQADAVSVLARTAVIEGADWVLPFDADEFWVCRAGSTRLADLLADEQAGCLRVTPENFPVPETLATFRSDDLAKLGRRFAGPDDRPVDDELRAQFLAGEHSFIPHTMLRKCVFRAHDGVRVAAGAHGVPSYTGPVEDRDDVRVLHIPLRDRGRLLLKQAHGARLAASGYGKDHGWQNQLLTALRTDEDVERLWRANTVDDDGIVTSAPCDRTVVDDALQRVAAAIADHPLLAALDPQESRPRPVRHGWEAHGLHAATTFAGEDVATGLREQLRAAQADNRALRAETARQAMLLEAHAARHQQDAEVSALAERHRAAAAELHASLSKVLASRSWRLTRPLRRLRRTEPEAVPASLDLPALPTASAWAEELVDRDWYLRRHPDVVASDGDPVEHFARYGLDEGRAPRPVVASDSGGGLEPVRQGHQPGRGVGSAASDEERQRVRPVVEGDSP
jgi:hypothetical protein